MESRPKIKLTLSPLDNTLELIGKILLVVMWGLTVYSFWQLPTKVPIHFNASGRADAYGNKMVHMILPVIGTLIYFGMTQLNKYPHIFNYLTKITEQNAHKQYAIATRTLRWMKLMVLFIFSLITLLTYLATIGVTNGLGSWFLPLVLALMFIPTVVMISQSLKKSRTA